METVLKADLMLKVSKNGFPTPECPTINWGVAPVRGENLLPKLLRSILSRNHAKFWEQLPVCDNPGD